MRRYDRSLTRLGKGVGFFFIFMAFFYPSPLLAKKIVVASTSLVGAIAKAAGAKEVRIICPKEIRHPPEYDLRPSDVLKFEGAEIVIYGGYERMVQKLLETSKNKGLLAIQINTETSPENLIHQVGKISKILGTEKEAKAWELEFIDRLKFLKEKISFISGKRAVVHRFAIPFSQWAGLNVVQIIAPGELTPKVVMAAVAKRPELVVDILHFPNAKVIADSSKCKYVQLINFPGILNKDTLESLFEYNTTQILEVFQ
jgi:hypothetical protein